jgi:hypothetical protein
MRTRKIRGDDSFVSSISIAEREEGAVAMGASSAWEDHGRTSNMAQPDDKKRSDSAEKATLFGTSG